MFKIHIIFQTSLVCRALADPGLGAQSVKFTFFKNNNIRILVISVNLQHNWNTRPSQVKVPISVAKYLFKKSHAFCTLN